MAQFQDALSFMSQVKEQCDQEDYHHFLETLKSFKMGSKSVFEVIQIIKNLFDGKPELIEGFGAFLPKGISTSSPEPSPASQPLSSPFPLAPYPFPAAPSAAPEEENNEEEEDDDDEEEEEEEEEEEKSTGFSFSPSSFFPSPTIPSAVSLPPPFSLPSPYCPAVPTSFGHGRFMTQSEKERRTKDERREEGESLTIESLRQQLLAAQQTIATLQQQNKMLLEENHILRAELVQTLQPMSDL